MMNSKKRLIAMSIAGSICISANSVAADIWKPVTFSKSTGNQASNSALFKVNTELLEQKLAGSKSGDNLELQVPLPNGEIATFFLTYNSILSPEMEALYPDLKTFKGYHSDNSEFSGRFDYTQQGFHGMFRYNGKYVYVEPSSDGSGYYTSYIHKRSSPFQDQILNYLTEKSAGITAKSLAKTHTTLRTYRLIVSTSGEYALYHGGTEAHTRAAITTAINRVNEVYNSDLAVNLKLVNFNIYTNASTDPFTDHNAGADISTNHTDLITKFGNDAFDIGHLFTTGGGGLAYLGATCNDSYKGEGVTGRTEPETDAFFIDYVAHELGHQFGANHTFNGTQSNCEGSNRNNSTAYEPGSGSTIMAYAGICGTDDLQANSDAYFHAASIAEINAHLATTSCGTTETQNNQNPIANAGNDYIVPASTPLLLTGSATDEDTTDSLTYVWEQMDAGTGNSNLTTDLGSGPLFRNWAPVPEPVRYIPRLSDVISGTLAKGETYATANRDLNFRLTVRDGNGGVSSDNMVINVDSSSGPFSVISPKSGANITGVTKVEWDTAGTNNSPVNCSKVDVLLSTDNGTSFSETLLSSTDNDGSQSINVSSYSLANTYLMIKCSDNIFFALSDAFTITAPESLLLADDTFNVVQDSATILFSVLNNDSGQGTLNINAINYTGAGTVSNTDTQISYQPAPGFTGNEVITYTVTDDAGQTGSATVTISVTNTIDALVVTNDEYSVRQNSAATLFNVLENDSGHGTLTISAVSYNGTGTVINTGTQVSYQPASGFNGSESFTYTITDEAQQTAEATITIVVLVDDITTPDPDDKSGGTINFLTLLILPLLFRRKVI